MKKLTLRQSRAQYNKGITLYLKPSKLSSQTMEFSPWFNWCDVVKCDRDPCSRFGCNCGETFDSIVNEYHYYNCNVAHGLRVNYYIK